MVFGTSVSVTSGSSNPEGSGVTGEVSFKFNGCSDEDLLSRSFSRDSLYLTVVNNLFSRAVVGRSLNSGMTTGLVNSAMLMALRKRKPAKSLIFHNDRGSQYAFGSHRELLTSCGFNASMSRKGGFWGSTVAEVFFHRLKSERVTIALSKRISLMDMKRRWSLRRCENMYPRKCWHFVVAKSPYVDIYFSGLLMIRC